MKQMKPMKPMKQMKPIVPLCYLLFVLLAAGGIRGEGVGAVDVAVLDYDGDGDVDEADLARASQNPVADMISLPFQNNILFDTAFGTVLNTNIQPVIPFSLNSDWNVITRTIVPVLVVEDAPPGVNSSAIGDTNFTAFFSPKEIGAFIWGVGPAISLPTATDRFFGSGKWSAGPSAVMLTMRGPWVIGALAQNVWSLGGWGDESVNRGLVQPFVNYNMADGWYLISAPVITVDWEADDRWTVPLGGGIGRVFTMGSQPVNMNLQGYYNVEKPTGGAEWSLRLQFQLLFPK